MLMFALWFLSFSLNNNMLETKKCFFLLLNEVMNSTSFTDSSTTEVCFLCDLRDNEAPLSLLFDLLCGSAAVAESIGSPVESVGAYET